MEGLTEPRRSGSGLHRWIPRGPGPLASPGVATGTSVKLIASSQYDESPVYSPDGRRIAFCSAASGAYEIWVVEEDGQSEIYAIGAEGGGLQRLTTHPASDVYPAYSRDGRWIYFSSSRAGPYNVWKIPAVGGGDPVTVLSKRLRIYLFRIVAEGIYFVAWPTLEDRTRWQFYRFSDGSTRTVMKTGSRTGRSPAFPRMAAVSSTPIPAHCRTTPCWWRTSDSRPTAVPLRDRPEAQRRGGWALSEGKPVTLRRRNTRKLSASELAGACRFPWSGTLSRSGWRRGESVTP